MSSKNLIGIAVAKRVHQFHFRDGFFPTLFGAGFLDDRRSGRAGGGGSVGRRGKNEGRRGRRHGGSFGDVGDGVNLSRVGHFGLMVGDVRTVKPIDRTGCKNRPRNTEAPSNFYLHFIGQRFNPYSIRFQKKLRQLLIGSTPPLLNLNWFELYVCSSGRPSPNISCEATIFPSAKKKWWTVTHRITPTPVGGPPMYLSMKL